MPLPFKFDFKKPDYREVFQWRYERKVWLDANPEKLAPLKNYYRENIPQFIVDWGCTFDARKIAEGVPATLPFILFPRQEEMVHWLIDRWKAKENGISEKSRDTGVSWIACATSAAISVLYDDAHIGFGSRTRDDVDTSGDPKSLFFKIRFFLELLPEQFRGGYIEDKNATRMLINIPKTRSKIFGGAGRNMGRGGRATLFFLDEAAHVDEEMAVESALAGTTPCRIDISTPRGRGNVFAEKRFSGKVPVFTFHWRDDPRKDIEWYKKECDRLVDPVIIAQELDLDYNASVEGVVIPAAHVQSAIDAHKKLKITPRGASIAALDVADGGKDINVVGSRTGILVNCMSDWTGVNSDLYETVVKSFEFCDATGSEYCIYDADGLGAGVRGDTRVVNEVRLSHRRREIDFVAFKGSSGVKSPSSDNIIPGRKNAEYFENFKSQSWWELRIRFLKTHRWVTDGIPCDPEEIISLDGTMPGLSNLIVELSQPVFTFSRTSCKLLVDKAPKGTKSPNYADMLMMLFSDTGQILDWSNV